MLPCKYYPSLIALSGLFIFNYVATYFRLEPKPTYTLWMSVHSN